MVGREFDAAFGIDFEAEPAPLPALPQSCWPVDWGCAETEWVEALDAGVKARSEAMATQVLRSLTAWQVGGCPIVVRPCAKSCGYTGSYIARPVGPSVHAEALGTQVGPWWASIDVDGQWINTWCGCSTDCSCSFVSEVVLPSPVGGVTEVVVDGVTLSANDYRVDNGNRLVRLDGYTWPKCQDMTAGVHEAGAFAVTYYNNYRPDGLASWVAGIMAVEFAKSCTGGKCRLPSGVQTISRLGVSMEIPSGMFDQGLTGIREVDSWIRLWNPYQVKSPSSVWSPDMRPARRTTSWPVSS
ncbi:MAG: hypothetical protein ABWZ30_05490 [Jiangellaceae bacterium]